MEINFKFEIGQFVSRIQDFNEIVRYNKLVKYDKRLIPQFMVISRIMEECYGGIQLHYQVRAVAGNTEILTRWSEIELIEAQMDAESPNKDE